MDLLARSPCWRPSGITKVLVLINMVLFAALPSERAVFYDASLSEWGHKYVNALLLKRG